MIMIVANYAVTVNIAIAKVGRVIVGQVEWSSTWGPTKSKLAASNRVRTIMEPRVIPSLDCSRLSV